MLFGGSGILWAQGIAACALFAAGSYQNRPQRTRASGLPGRFPNRKSGKHILATVFDTIDE
jgi:hypothetical protein